MNFDCRYDAHGTEIISDLALPEFISSQGAHGSPLLLSASGGLPLPDLSGERFWVDQSGFYIAWAQVGTFHVTVSGQIRYHRVPGASDELIRVPLLGSVLAVALYYRGILVMHGNAMSVCGEGIILVGSKGQGKSTLSAALVSRGHQVQAEDAASVYTQPDGLVVALRGTRQLRLWQDSMERSFGGASPPSRQIHELSEKRVVPISNQAEVPAHLPLKRIYILENADEIATETLGPAEAWQQVLVHSLVSRFGTALLTGPGASRHFAACAALAKGVRCVRLRRPRDFSRLHEVAARIEEDLSEV